MKINGHSTALSSSCHEYFSTLHGKCIYGDSLDYMQYIADESVDLVITSPPFGLVRKKEYGNVEADKYLSWFRLFASNIFRILKDSGSLIIDIGGTWNPNIPTRHLYHFKLMIMLCEEFQFHLAQDFYWWNPAKLPTPAEWVAVRRIRVKDAINKVWWLSKTPWPKANNTRVLHPYSESMEHLLKHGYRAKRRPSGHNISRKFSHNNGAAIPSNLIAVSNTESNTQYLEYCKFNNIKPHPARFPAELPEFFIRMLTDKGDFVIDPFAGSCVTGEVCERLGRKWACVELREEYLAGARGRFALREGQTASPQAGKSGMAHYQVPRPGLLWSGTEMPPRLEPDGGRSFQRKRKEAASRVAPGKEDDTSLPVAVQSTKR